MKISLKELTERLMHDYKFACNHNLDIYCKLKILRHRQRIIQCCIENVNNKLLNDIYLSNPVDMDKATTYPIMTLECFLNMYDTYGNSENDICFNINGDIFYKSDINKVPENIMNNYIKDWYISEYIVYITTTNDIDDI